MSISLASNYKLEPNIQKKDITGLNSYGVSKYPGTFTGFAPSYNVVTRKYTTGLDSEAKEILAIQDPKKREAKQKEIKRLKEKLEAYYGKPGLLDADSTFWDSFIIPVVTSNDLKTYIELDGKTFDLNPTDNPVHMLALIVLDANNFLPKNKEEAGSPDFLDAKFYLTTQEEEDKESEDFIRKEIEVGKNLSMLFGDKVNYELAFEIAYYLGLAPKMGCSEPALRKMLYQATKESNFASKFITACGMEKQDLLIANIFKKAVKLDIIKYNGFDKMYFRGGVNFRDTEDNSIEYLKSPEMAKELAQLREAVNKKAANSKNIY